MEADLAQYYPGVELAAMWSGGVTVRRISVLVAWLPRGARVWQMLGGREAITRETEAVWGLEATQLGIAWSSNGRKGRQPQAREYPLGADAIEEKSTFTERNATAWRRKYGNRKKR